MAQGTEPIIITKPEPKPEPKPKPEVKPRSKVCAPIKKLFNRMHASLPTPLTPAPSLIPLMPAPAAAVTHLNHQWR